MNISFSSLRITSSLSTSPWIIQSLGKKILLNSILLNNFFSPFLISAIFNNNMSISHSKFYNFLHVPLKIQKVDNTFGNQIFKKTFEILSNPNAYIKIYDCSFENCQNRAIYIKEKDCQTEITKCKFDNCRISKNGGAVYTKCKYLECSFCHFYRCTTVFEGWWGSALYAHESKFTKLNQLSILNCPQFSIDMDSQITVFKGSVESYFHNYTKGIHRFASGLRLSNTDANHSIIRYVITNSHKSGNSISFVNIYFPGQFSHILCMNNTCNHGLIYLSMTDLCISDSVFLNNRGDLTYLHVDAQIKLVSCVIDKIDDKENKIGSCSVTTEQCEFNKENIKINEIKMFDISDCGYNKK
ncbi:hypothetical protein TRFO_19371 [Tritrichomonas foetus]|uniref:Right handed beta helix domain-containing protein n=1 Tax=Tritrichomonas foetus TaxID=1144522 RepID=A0A1J4KNJ0_9EUKA|nr:hypothetical protein TRFO_19371 [Tritrichomonas foetus]|eukprot:OHT11270.1 hypothetical protein TRFO_19371 [Tritrichomonas foetus]